MGISVQSSGIAVEKSKFYLVNLNADPSMNELLVYYLKVILLLHGHWTATWFNIPIQALIFSGFLFASAKVASITLMIFFHLMIQHFHSLKWLESKVNKGRVFFKENPKTDYESIKFLNNSFWKNAENQIVPCESTCTAEEVLFEWSHHRISSADSKVRTTY